MKRIHIILAHIMEYFESEEEIAKAIEEMVMYDQDSHTRDLLIQMACKHVVIYGGLLINHSDISIFLKKLGVKNTENQEENWLLYIAIISKALYWIYMEYVLINYNDFH